MSHDDPSNCEISERLDETEELKRLQQWWQELNEFTHTIHSSLRPADTSYAIANEGRRLVGCDRLSVALRRHKSCRVAAISGQASINRRGNTVRLLERLCSQAVVTGEPLCYPVEGTELAPQIESVLESYLDESQVKSLLVYPFDAPANQQNERTVSGALMVENFSAATITLETRDRIKAIAPHSSSALHNALEHHGVFGLPIWKALGKASAVVTGRTAPKSLVFLLCLLAVSVALYAIPANFSLTASGTLQPERRRNVFAGVDGVVAQLLVHEGAVVAEGCVMAELRNSELDLKVEEIVGQLQTTSKKLSAMRTTRLARTTQRDVDPASENQMVGEEEELRLWLKSLEQQHALLIRQREQLKVRSPLAGEVVTWSLRDKLASRPVTRGQLMMTVADLSGPWVLELLVSDRRVGHLLNAQQQIRSDLDVSFILAAAPNEEFQGRIKKVAKSAQLDEAHGQSVLVTVSIDKHELELLRPGVGVTGKIHCGRRSLGYVWLHDIIEFVQSRILFRL